MIDAAVMADVKQQCLQRDGGFDLGKVFSECAHCSRTATSARQTTKSRMQRSSVSFLSGVLVDLLSFLCWLRA